MSIEISEIVRTRRKTIALVITPDAKLIVRAPLSTPKEYIRRLVEKRGSGLSESNRK